MLSQHLGNQFLQHLKTSKFSTTERIFGLHESVWFSLEKDEDDSKCKEK